MPNDAQDALNGPDARAREDGCVIRRMREDDLDAGLRLSRIAGWNQLHDDWRLFYRLHPSGAFVVQHRERVVGTVTTTDYGGRVGWVAMVLVDPGFRRRGIATRLLERAMEALAHLETVQLDATPAGREVYRRLGFRDEFGLQRLVGDPDAMPPGPRSAGRVRPMTGADMETVIALDATALGVARPAVIEGLYGMAPEYGMVHERGDAMDGFILGRHGAHFEFAGPLVAHGPDGATELLRSFCRQAGRASVALDVPDASAGWCALLREGGMRPRRAFTRMYRGQDALSGRTELMFAAAGPELG